MMQGMIGDSELPTVVSELEEIKHEAPRVTQGAILILKNELDPKSADDPKRNVLFERSYTIPEPIASRIRDSFRKGQMLLWVKLILREFWLWLKGNDNAAFRDRCDSYFWKKLVPDINEAFGDMADHVLNTINEAIINYAEHSFGRHAMRRQIHVFLFKTDDDLAYAVIRPSGSPQRTFNPLSLQTRPKGIRSPLKRGWGHTLIMERALFLSFDRHPDRRGMLIIMGPEEEPTQTSAIPSTEPHARP
jgi:hypothetical protein